jgi:response regulator RpfG family c-di-GMP phosphodiesterase
MTNYSDLLNLLSGCLNILTVDDSEVILRLIKGTLSPIRAYKVYNASSAKEADCLLGKEIKFHACISDMGLNDINNNEFYLIEKYGKTIPFIVLTGRNDTPMGFKCREKDAHAIIQKETDETLLKIKTAVKYSAVRSRLDGELLKNHIDILMKAQPKNVSEWAREIGISDSRLRKAWQQAYERNPKHILFLHRLLNFVIQEDDLDEKEQNDNFNPDNQNYKAEYIQMMEYLNCNRSVLKKCGKTGDGFI